MNNDQKKSLLIYTSKITNRNKYAFNLVFKDILCIDYALTTDIEAFKNHSFAKINYSSHPIGDELFFLSRTLLFETGISEQNITVWEWQGCKVFFSTGKISALPFDPFAASFYLVSRYEEYLPHIRDEYDRFDVKESFAYRNGFLQIPVVNIWAEWVKEVIVTKYPDFNFPQRSYKYISTIDIDNAYAYREKGMMRTLGGYGRSFLKFDVKEMTERTQVLLGLKKDPYDTYDLLLDIQKRYQLEPIYFFLMAEYGVNDKNLPVENKKFQSLIKMIGDYAEVGIHPSFGSNTDPKKLKKELGRLSKILKRDVTKSRQHFLRLVFPETYRNLIDLDVTDDYTMGYASQIGFRASICTPFYFYDLDMEIETQLKIHPFMAMEATLKYYMKIKPEEALSKIKPLIDQVKKVNGEFISLWHNEALSDEKEWKGWKAVYEEMVKMAVVK